jgi:uncharacterized protein with FMN-binding domain
MKKGVKILLIILGVLIVIAVFAAVFMSQTNKNLEALSGIQVEDYNIAAIPDGMYKGSFKSFPVEAEVAVTVADGKITDIELIKHTNGKGAAAESIPEAVVEKQTLQVDTVSGATYSSKVILLAIETALKNAG